MLLSVTQNQDLKKCPITPQHDVEYVFLFRRNHFFKFIYHFICSSFYLFFKLFKPLAMANDSESMAHTAVIGGRNPLIYATSNPLTLFLIQAFIILSICRLAHFPLSYFHQPRVVAELLTGVLLGTFS